MQYTLPLSNDQSIRFNGIVTSVRINTTYQDISTVDLVFLVEEYEITSFEPPTPIIDASSMGVGFILIGGVTSNNVNILVEESTINMEVTCHFLYSYGTYEDAAAAVMRNKIEGGKKYQLYTKAGGG